MNTRREFFKFLAASPYLAHLAARAVAAQSADALGAPAGALNVFDFEEAARRKVSTAHWGYMLGVALERRG